MGFEYFWVLGWLTLALWAYLIRCFQMGSTNPSGTTEIPYDVPPNVTDSNDAPRILHQTQSTSTNRDDKTVLKTNIICQTSWCTTRTLPPIVVKIVSRDWRDLVFYTSLPSLVSVVLVRLISDVWDCLWFFSFFHLKTPDHLDGHLQQSMLLRPSDFGCL